MSRVTPSNLTIGARRKIRDVYGIPFAFVVRFSPGGVTEVTCPYCGGRHMHHFTYENGILPRNYGARVAHCKPRSKRAPSYYVIDMRPAWAIRAGEEATQD